MIDGEPHISPAPTGLRVDGRAPDTAGRHVLTAVHQHPRLSWTVPLVRSGQRQDAFEIRTSWGHTPLGGADPWGVAGAPMPPHARGEWKVRVLDENDVWSEWSASCTVEAGPFSLTDWSAHWVSSPALSTARRTFRVSGPISSARLHLTAQGLVRAEVNGTAVNPDASDPSRTDIERALHRTYDVSDLVVVGSNDLGLTLASGEWERTGLDPRVLAELVIDLVDGSRVVAGTGPGMTATSSTVTAAVPFYLERHEPTTVDTALAAPLVLQPTDHPGGPHEPPAQVLPDPSPPIRVIASFDCEPLGASGRVFGVGANIAGRSRVTLRSAVPPGTVVTVIHGEYVGADGHVDTTNLSLPHDAGRPRQVVEYVATGHPGQVLEPWFCYHGFAYLEISGLPDDAVIDVVARSLHTDLETVSTLDTDEPLVGTLITSARRTLLNNVHGIPEDCPTREQSGWTGDTASTVDFEFASFDMQAFFDKWLGDLRTSQQADGSIPAIAPDVRSEPVPSDPVWGAAVQRVLLLHWLTYGDSRVVAENIGMLRRWVDFQMSCVDREGLIGHSPISYGHDWLALAQTPPRLLHTAATIESLECLILLEGPDEVRTLQLEALRAAAIARFVPDELAVGNGSQGSLATAIAARWLDPARVAIAADAIDADVRARGNRLSSGFASTRTVVRALAALGHSQTLMDTLHQPLAPGIGAMLASGPGTFWENWWMDPTNTGTGSLDHLGLGGPIAGWAECFLAGITPTTAGFARFDVHPRFVREVTTLDYSRQTVRGRIEVSYRRENHRVLLRLMVPVGAEARVVLPGSEATTVGSGCHTFEATWMPEPGVPSAVTAPWLPPARLESSPDVRDGSSWLESAVDEGRVVATLSTVRREGLRCMPVPHAQVAGPVVVVTGDPVVRLDFREPIEVGATSFVYAEIDTCDSGPAEPVSLVIELLSADGTRLRATGRFWPAGWNRVTVDIAGWRGRVAIIGVEVSVEFAPGGAPLSFVLGSVGVSDRPRTW